MNEDKSTRYHRHRRWAESFALAVQAAPLIACVGLGLSPWGVDRAREMVRFLTLPETALSVAAIFALMLAVLADVLALPASWYRRFFWSIDIAALGTQWSAGWSKPWPRCSCTQRSSRW